MSQKTIKDMMEIFVKRPEPAQTRSIHPILICKHCPWKTRKQFVAEKEGKEPYDPEYRLFEHVRKSHPYEYGLLMRSLKPFIARTVKKPV